MEKDLDKISAVENKYGLVLFRMGLTYLIDVGVRHLNDENIDEYIHQIGVETGNASIMTPDFKREVVHCAAELAKFSIWTLIAYIKKYVAVDYRKN